MISNKKLNIIFITVYCLASFYFYRPVSVGLPALKAIYTVLLFLLSTIVLHFTLKNRFKKNFGEFILPMKLMLFSIVFSIIPSYISWGQSIDLSILSLMPYLGYLFFFYLVLTKPEITELEAIVVRIGFITLCILVLSIIIYPNVIFGAKDEEDISLARGFARVAIPGMGFMFLAYFISLNKYVSTKKNKWLFYALLFLIGVFLTLTRQVIAGCVVLGTLFLMKEIKNIFFKAAVISILIALLAYVSSLPFVENLLLLTRDQTETFSEDIRVIAGKYFLFDFSPDMFTAVFGNGESSAQKSSYGNFVTNLKETYGYFQSDVGFIGFYSKFGVLGIISWYILYLRLWKLKLPQEIQYVNYYMLLVMLTGLTASFMINVNYIATICIVIYVANSYIKYGITKMS